MSEQENTFVTVRMPSELVKQIDELATEAMRSRSAQVIIMLKQALERGEQNVSGS
jgi:predicted transcriptional regulator